MSAHVKTWADGCGNWHASARADIPHFDFDNPLRDTARATLAERAATDAAKRAVLDAIATREHKTGETLGAARKRVRAYLRDNPLKLEYHDVNPHNQTVTVTYGERGEP